MAFFLFNCSVQRNIHLSTLWKRVTITALMGIALVACTKDKDRLQGERIEALESISNYAPSPDLADIAIDIPKETPVRDWTVAGQNNLNIVGNMAFNSSLKRKWKASVAGTNRISRLVPPVFSTKTIYIMDADHNIIALSQATGKKQWTFKATVPDGDKDSFGGGLTLHQGRLLVSTPYGKLYALDASTGFLLWEKTGFLPLSGGTTVVDDIGFVPNIDNTLLAYNVTNGDILWRHVGFRESSALFGVAPPAYKDGIVFAGYSNGELYAIRATDGLTIWSEGLSGIITTEGLNTISHVRGLPIVDGNTVFAISHAGRMLALDTTSSRLIWDRNIGSANTPWLAGNMLYITTIEGSIIAVHKADGLVKWRTEIPRFADQKDKEDAIAWSAPVMADGQLWVVNSLGQLKSLNPKTGKITGTHSLGGKLYIPPVVVNGTMYILANNGTLYALGK